MKHTNKKGFTIIELVIVIAVIAILAAILIPTFAGLIKKANLSVDMQVVKQMNTVLQTNEVVSGKPATVVDAKEILAANGCDDFTPADSDNVYYWVGSENRVILWEKSKDDATKGKVTFPNDLAKKYKGITTVSAAWSDLSIEITDENYVKVEVEEGETVKDALFAAIEQASDGAILQLPENSELQLATGGLYWLGESLRNDGGTGKHITIDLNGGKLVSSGSNARFTRTEDGTGWLTDEDGDYVMNILEVPANGELILANGSLDIQHGNQPALASIITHSGSKLVLRDVDLDTTTAGILPAGDASEVVIENSTINALNYALATNRLESSNIRITINNSELSATYSTAVMINTNSDTHIYNSTITGVVHAIALRAGALELVDSTLVTTDTEPGIYAYDNFAEGYNFQGWWGTGNTMPGGTLVVGDYAMANPDGSFSYSGNAVVKMTNTKLQSANSNAIPEILLAASDPAKQVSVDYDATSTAGNIQVYGKTWNGVGDNVGVVFNHRGTISVNGVTQTVTFINAIPSIVGTFAAGQEYSVSELDKTYYSIPETDHTDSVKKQISEKYGITLSETEWASAKLTFSSSKGNNVLKSITYTLDSDGTETTLENRITLLVGTLGLNSEAYTNLSFATMNFVEPAQEFSYLDVFKANCEANGIVITDSTKIIIGDTANVIVGVN